MLDPTNADRADRAYRAVEAYAELLSEATVTVNEEGDPV